MADEEKAKFKELINKAHTLRNVQKGSSSTPKTEDLKQMQEWAQECLNISEKLNMEHGKALSLELLGYAKMIELDVNNPIDKKDVIVTAEERENIMKKYAELDTNLKEAQKLAISYGDVHLVTRILENLANIYRRSDQYEREIITIEQAVKISRTIPKVMALIDAYQRMINFLFQYHADKADDIVKFHTHYWENYLWLKDQPAFEREKFIHAKRISLYKVAVYIGSIAGNPLNLGEQNPENFAIAGEAYDEAIYIATVLKNNELLCAAHSHKAFMLLPKINPEEKRNLLSLLISLENTYHPESTELRDVIQLMKQQLDSSSSS